VSTSPEKPPRSLVFKIGVALVFLGPAFGLVAMVAGMLHSFHRIEANAAPTPAELARAVHWTMFASVGGAVLGVLGVALTVGSLIASSRKKPRAIERWN
jgi:small-conductance mechanosensitive channel